MTADALSPEERCHELGLVQLVSPMAPAEGAIRHWCFLCGARWDGPVLMWPQHNAECRGLSALRGRLALGYQLKYPEAAA